MALINFILFSVPILVSDDHEDKIMEMKRLLFHMLLCNDALVINPAHPVKDLHEGPDPSSDRLQHV